MNEMVTYVLGGGMVSALLGLLTLHAKVRKSYAETARLNLENSQSATQILIDNIVEPLNTELHATRKEFESTKREMARLRQAITSARTCPYVRTCPVVHELQDGAPRCGRQTDGISPRGGDAGGGDDTASAGRQDPAAGA